MSFFIDKIKVISLKNLRKTFTQNSTNIDILKDVNFEFKKNTTYALSGTSGTGKSTLIHIISGFESATSGAVYYDNYDIKKLEQTSQIIQESIGLVFQYPYLIPELNILENIIIKDLIAKKDKTNLKKEAYELLDKMGLADKALSYPSQLSGGEQQRVSISRAIFNKPTFLIADEPTAHLDNINKDIIINLLINYQKEYGKSLIIATHDYYVCKAMQIQTELDNGILKIKE